ncbi:uncharacterized protein KY384_002788 [Bacidia gigantensis]|uniref:uncharacterized protein n=1 Tax=Bacidia gigantensis TaxID=2732470 RepID=UPI001D04C0B7|nr:uncharacterized protein KY384_002788 [Bacidia gigantensis]KAG8532910.1 hypothetical protein KY384_002788 [Bacidia gigantensis]
MTSIDPQKFLSIFSEILAPDTSRVKSATALLKSDFYPNPASLTTLLELLLTSSQPSPLRQLAASQSRALISKHWRGLPANEKASYRERLLAAAVGEEDRKIRNGIARTVTSVAKLDLEDGEWAAFGEECMRAAMAGEAAQREVGTYLLFTGLEALGEELAGGDRKGQLLRVFGRTIADQESTEVRMNTLLGLSRLAMLLDSEEKGDRKALEAMQEAVPQMVGVLKGVIDEGDEARVTQGFEVFQTLLGCDSQVLNRHFGDLVQFMCGIAGGKEVEEDTRTQAISFLMQCMRYRKLKMQSLKVGEQITLMCLEIATEIPREAVELDEEDVTTPRSALALLDEMAECLPPSQVVVPLLHALGPYVNSPDPDRRQGGIMALGMVVEGAPDFIATQLHQIFPLVLRLLEDEDIKVRRAALDGVMRIAEELPEELGKEHEKLMPSLVKHMEVAMKSLKGMDDKINLGIISATCNSVETVVDGLDKKDMKQYLPQLMPRLSRLFTHPDLRIKSGAIGAVGSIAVTAKEDFLPYFEDTMDSMQEYVEMKSSPEELDLRARTIDAMGSIARAVGSKAFQRYVRPLMQATDEGLHLEHPKLKETSFMFWATMAKVYEEDFKPFMPGVVKALFECLETEESDLEVDFGDDAKDLAGKEVTIGGKKIKVAALAEDDFVSADEIEDLDDLIADTSDDDWDDDDIDVVSAVAQEKEIAVEVMGDILTHATKDYLPYLEKTVETILPLTEHSYEGVQKASLSTLFRAYAAVWDLQPEEIRKWTAGIPVEQEPSAQVKKLGEIVMTAMLVLWKDEVDRATITDINRNLAQTLKASGPSLISEPKVLKEVTEILIAILTKEHPCQKDFMGTEAEDFGMLDENSEYDWLTIDTAMDAVAGVAQALGTSFSQLWKMFEKPVLKYASSSEPIERATAVGVISECTRAMSDDVSPYTEKLLPLLMKRLTDEDPDTKSNAAFAVGVLVEASSEEGRILKQFPTIFSKLEPLLQMDEARCKDNAAGCVSRMIMKHPGQVPIPQVVQALLEILPLREDYDENEPVYDMIVGLCKCNSGFTMNVWAANTVHSADSKGERTIVGLTPQLLPILAEVLAPEPENQLKDETREKIVQLVKFVAGKHPGEVRKYEGLAALV